jgi:hypothetical protein
MVLAFLRDDDFKYQTSLELSKVISSHRRCLMRQVNKFCEKLLRHIEEAQTAQCYRLRSAELYIYSSCALDSR